MPDREDTAGVHCRRVAGKTIPLVALKWTEREGPFPSDLSVIRVDAEQVAFPAGQVSAGNKELFVPNPYRVESDR